MNPGDAKRAVLSHTMHLAVSAADVFPLLCPMREYDWIEHWRCEVLHTESGVAERGCVFRTDFPDGGRETWTVCRHEPPHGISFVRTGMRRTTLYDIDLTDEADGGCSLVWRQDITGLEESAGRGLAVPNEAGYAERMRLLERMLGHYLATGTMLRTGAAGD